MNQFLDFFCDDGTPIDLDLVPKPGLYILCQKNDDPSEEISYILTRANQQGVSEFICDAFEQKKQEP